MGLGLSHFDAPTGFAVLANSATSTLNNRKEFLTELGFLNRIGRKQDDVTVVDGDVRIDGRDLSAVARDVRERGHGRLVMMATAAFVRRATTVFRTLSEGPHPVVNPWPIPQLLSDKGLQYWELYDQDVTVPPFQPLDHYLGDGNGATTAAVRRATDRLRAAFIADAPLVLKSRTGTQGQDIWFYPGGIDSFRADWLDGTAPEPFAANPGEFLLQYAIPHDHDLRIIAAGPHVVTGERRYGSPHTDRSNLNLVPTRGNSHVQTARDLLERGAVEALEFDDHDPAIQRVVEDVHSAVRDSLDDPPDPLHTWVGWDFLVVDPDDDRLAAIPDAVLEAVLDPRYRTDDGRYLVFGEGNLSPGSKERYVNALSHGRAGLEFDSAANLFAYGHSISQRRPFEPGLPDAIDRDALAERYAIQQTEQYA